VKKYHIRWFEYQVTTYEKVMLLPENEGGDILTTDQIYAIDQEIAQLDDLGEYQITQEQSWERCYENLGKEEGDE